MSASASVLAIFGSGVVAGIVVGFAWYKGLDLTGVHHVDTRAKTPRETRKEEKTK